MRISDWSSDVCSSDLANTTRFLLCIPKMSGMTGKCLSGPLPRRELITRYKENSSSSWPMKEKCPQKVTLDIHIIIHIAAYGHFEMKLDRKSTRLNSSH